MLDKGILVALITGFTAIVFTVWITVDFCLYRRKKAAIRAAKADTYYRKPHSERVVAPFQQKKTSEKDKKVPPVAPKKPKRTLSVRKFVNFITRQKGTTDVDDKEAVIRKENDVNESETNVKKGHSIAVSKVEAGGSSKLSSAKSADKETKTNGVSKETILEEGGVKAERQPHPSPNGKVLSKIQSAPNVTGKWTNTVGPSELPTGKNALPPLKGKSSSKPKQEGKASFSGEHIKEEINGGEDVKSSSADIELNEIKEDKVKLKHPFKQKRSKGKMKVENDVFFSSNEQSGTEPKVNTIEASKKPPLLKRISRNRVDSINDGSTSSTDTRETFMEERASTTSSSWTCDEITRKRTGSFSDSTTSSGSIELENRKFRLKPLKRNQSNLSVSDTTPLT